MKYIKQYEDVNRKYKIGDYVICDEMEGNNGVTKELKKFLANNIGQITDNTYGDTCLYVVRYENIPNMLRERFNEIIKKDIDGVVVDEYDDRRVMIDDEIIYSSKNKKDLEPFIILNKFNI